MLKRLVFLALFLATISLPRALPPATHGSQGAQQDDPFYVTLLEKAQKSFLARNFEDAGRNLEVAAFGLSTNKVLRSKALVYLSLCQYYLKDIKSSEKSLREAAELMGAGGFAGLKIDESALPDIEKLSVFFNLPLVQVEVPAKEPETSIVSNPGTDAKASEKPPATKETQGEAAQNVLSKPLSEIKEGDLVPLEMVDTPPAVIKRVDPVYPPSAKGINIEGTVLLNALISEKGEVAKTEILMGIKGAFGFNQASQRAVRAWKFSPASINGINVRVWMPIAIQFKAQEPDS